MGNERVVDVLVDGSFLRKEPKWLDVVAVLVFCLATSLATSYLREIKFKRQITGVVVGVLFTVGELVLIGVVTVASGFYYYFKVIRAMYWQPAPEDSTPVVVSKASSLAIYTLAALILILGVYPQLLIGILP